MLKRCGLEGAPLTLNSGVMRSSLAAAKTFFCIFLHFWGVWGIQGSIPDQNWHFFSSLQQSWDLLIQDTKIKLYMPWRGWVAESGGTRSKTLFFTSFYTKIGSQNGKNQFFQNSLVQIKDNWYPWPCHSHKDLWEVFPQAQISKTISEPFLNSVL